MRFLVSLFRVLLFSRCFFIIVLFCVRMFLLFLCVRAFVFVCVLFLVVVVFFFLCCVFVVALWSFDFIMFCMRCFCCLRVCVSVVCVCTSFFFVVAVVFAVCFCCFVVSWLFLFVVSRPQMQHGLAARRIDHPMQKSSMCMEGSSPRTPRLPPL